MELDKRIIEGKKPLDCFDIEIAKQFIGKKGLFGSHKSQFMNLDTCPKCVVDELNKIDNYDEYPFVTSGNHAYMYFLPEEWVKESEKKYRAFTLAEWIDQHEIGEVIRFRNTCNQEFNVMYLGYILDTNDDIQDIRTKGQIMFVSTPYTLQELFERYEICINGEWLPFGVIEDE